MAYLEFLKKVEAFQDLTDAQLTVIEKAATEKSFQQGQQLFKEGETANHLWVVRQGRVDLRFDLPGRETSGESTLSSVHENRIMGWSSLIPPHQYKLSAYCASPEVRVLLIEREQLMAYLKENPGIGYRVLSAMLRIVGARFQKLQETAVLKTPVKQTDS